MGKRHLTHYIFLNTIRVKNDEFWIHHFLRLPFFSSHHMFFSFSSSLSSPFCHPTLSITGTCKTTTITTTQTSTSINRLSYPLLNTVYPDPAKALETRRLSWPVRKTGSAAGIPRARRPTPGTATSSRRSTGSRRGSSTHCARAPWTRVAWRSSACRRTGSPCRRSPCRSRERRASRRLCSAVGGLCGPVDFN
jgi:hypothetical protein